MIIWALVSSYWYCRLQAVCTQAPAPVAVVNKNVNSNDTVKVQQPIKEVPKEVAQPEPEPEPIKQEELTAPVEVPKIDQKCTDYLDGNLKPGSSANTKQVATKVEEFLNKYENTNLTVDGIYGSQDVQAVNAFQQKYATEILRPLGLAGPTGNVLGSTRAHINKLYCQNFDKQQ